MIHTWTDTQILILQASRVLNEGEGGVGDLFLPKDNLFREDAGTLPKNSYKTFHDLSRSFGTHTQTPKDRQKSCYFYIRINTKEIMHNYVTLSLPSKIFR